MPDERDPEMIELYNKGFRSWWFIAVALVLIAGAFLIGMLVGYGMGHDAGKTDFKPVPAVTRTTRESTTLIEPSTTEASSTTVPSGPASPTNPGQAGISLTG